MLRTKKNRPTIKHRYAEVWGFILFGVAVLLAISLVDYDPARNPLGSTDFKGGGYTGVVGTVVAYVLYLVFGLGALVIPAFLFYVGVSFIIRKPTRALILNTGYALMLAVSLSCIAELQQGLDLTRHFPFMAGMSFGGVLGEKVGTEFLKAYLGPAGAAVVAVMGFVISSMLLTRVQFYPYAKLTGRAGRKVVFLLIRNLKKIMGLAACGARALLGMSQKKEVHAKKVARTVKVHEQTKRKERTTAKKRVSPQRAVKEGRPTPRAVGDYHLPSIELLNLPPPFLRKGLVEDLKKNAETLEKTFSDFGIDASVGEIQRGPVITRYEVHPAPGVKVTRIASLAEDIALAMKVAGIRVTPPIPGKGAIGLEIPNARSRLVCIREVLSSREFRESKAIIPLGIGKSVAGKVVVADLTQMPHLLIAGATGSGKSVCINAILITLLHQARPHELKLLIVDPKKIELGCYNTLPHLLVPVVTDSKKVAHALNWLVVEMERRYDYLSKAGVRNIAAYNARPITRSKRADDEEQLPDRLPYIVTIIDELADLMIIAPAEVEMAITRLAQLSRSVGIHLILATQRPSVNVITGVIKANFPARISFQVASKVDSRTVIDANGAETLVGNGDLLFMPPGTSKLIRAQGTYVDDAEILRVAQFVKDQAGPAYNEEVLAKERRTNAEQDEETIEDELFDQAVEIILRTGQASASNLQRKMKIGYARAGRIIDMMERRGIVGPANGSKPRKILVASLDT
ncbi:DNA translocase FtsK [bacterium]|nr:DNA translocase FtsK [bacterium]